MSVDSMHTACFKYQLPGSNDVSPLARGNNGIHIHIAIIDCWDVQSVLRIKRGQSGVWDFVSSQPRLSLDSAVILFNEVKSSIRREYKDDPVNGLLLPANCCVSGKIISTIDHLYLNQGISLYNPTRDGVSTF